MQLVRAMEVGSFASFLSKKKRQYAAVYPFLRADQIEAKLRRIWTNKKAHCAGRRILKLPCLWFLWLFFCESSPKS